VISVITPTYHNWTELERAIASLEAQAFTDWQHVVVSDGPDPVLREILSARGYGGSGRRVLVELGRNWHGFLGGDSGALTPEMIGRPGRGSRGASTGMVGTYIAAGDWIAYLDEDCEYHAHHLQVCADVLAGGGLDMVFARMERWLNLQPWDLVGDGLVEHGHIDGNMVVHRPELLRVANWRRGGDSDWEVIRCWRDAGMRYGFIPQVGVRWHGEE
jgi:glycosyltransferase involved in cell wall biosynthesis